MAGICHVCFLKAHSITCLGIPCTHVNITNVLVIFYTHVEEACDVTSYGLHVIATTTRQTVATSEDIGICKLNS